MPTAIIDKSNQPLIYCNFCKTETHHIFRGDCKSTNNCLDEASCAQINFVTTYSLLQCNACGQGCLQVSEWNSENGQTLLLLHPVRKITHPPEWIHRLEHEIKILLIDSYEAINHGMYALTAMGIRAILDTWVSQKTSSENNFANKLNKLKKEELLNKQQHEVFQKIFDFGSAVIHRRHIPNQEDTMTALQTLVNLLHQDILKHQIDALAENTPRRK